MADGGGFVHREVGQAIGFLVELPAHVFERHAADAADERAGVLIERLEAGILHAVLAAELLDEQLGIRADVQRPVPVVHRPRQGGQQAVVFRDVVGGVREAAVQLGDHRAVVAHNLHAVARGARVAARAAIDVRRDHAVSGSGRLGRRRRRRHVVEDALAAVALDDAAVQADLDEHLRPQAHLALAAPLVLGGDHGDALAAARDRLVGGDHRRRQLGDQRRALRQRPLSSVVPASASCTSSAARSFTICCSAILQRRLGRP